MTTVLGTGGYGFVVKPALSNIVDGVETEFPGNVTKIFIYKPSYDKIVDLDPVVKNLFGNNTGHRMSTYVRKRTKKNLPTSIQKYIPGENEDPIYPIRLPYLGVNFSKIEDVHKQLRRIPVLTLLNQVVKLLGQVYNAGEKGYIHGNIRENNVMVNPSTGVMTLIGFDWLEKGRDFLDTYPLRNGYYYTPPECLNLNSDNMFQSFISHVSLGRSHTYGDYFFKAFPYIYTFYKTGWEVTEAVKEVIEKNVPVLGNRYIHDTDTPYMFDAFGLANTLLNLFYFVYPTSIHPMFNVPTMKALLSHRITKYGTEYTDEELDACLIAIRAMAAQVLLPLAEFDYQKRIPIGDAFRIAKDIQAELSRRINKDMLSANGPFPSSDPPLTAEEAKIAPGPRVIRKNVARNLHNIFGNKGVRRTLKVTRNQAAAMAKAEEADKTNPITTAFANLLGGKRSRKH
jgi:hypothetical protein